MSRRLFVAVLGAVVLACLFGAPAAIADTFTPESGGSSNADDIDTLYKITLYVGIVIFLLVEGTLIWSLVRHRARRGGRAAQNRGNTPLEIGWTLGAASILVVLTVVTFLYLDDIENPPASGPNGLNTAQFASVDQPNPPRGGGPFLTIRVNGQQYIWRYDYMDSKKQLFSYNRMVVPTDTTVVLKIESSDVIHSWWIPKFGPKADAVPGHVNETSWSPTFMRWPIARAPRVRGSRARRDRAPRCVPARCRTCDARRSGRRSRRCDAGCPRGPWPLPRPTCRQGMARRERRGLR